jgi:fibronectin-binding autotransporter adhesin
MAVTRLSGRRRMAIGGAVAAAMASLAVCHPAMAGSASWIGSANAVDAWATGTNWDSGSAPGANDGTIVSTDTATFGGTPTSLTISIDQNRNIGNIVFDNTSSLFTIGSTTGPALNLTSGGALTMNNTLSLPSGVLSIRQNIAAPLVIDGAFTLVDNVGNNTSTSAAGGVTISGGVTGTATGPATLFLDGTDDATATVGVAQVTSVISDGPGGPTSVVKNGIGTWELRATATAANSYSGDTIINNGILRFSTNVGSSSPNSRIIINNGGQALFSTDQQTAGPIVLNPGGLLKLSSSSRTVNVMAMSSPGITFNFATGTAASVTQQFSLIGTTANQGGITLVASSTTPAIDFGTSGATNNNFGIGSAMRPFNIGLGSGLNSTGTAAGYDFRVRDTVTGGSATGGITKLGAGILRFDNAANPFTGTLEVTEGGVVGNASSPPLNNQFTGLPTLLIDGPTGDFHVNGGQTQTFGSVSMTAGTLSASSNITSTIIAASYGFNIAAGNSATANTVLADAVSPSFLTMSGAGIAYLTGANSYTGGTTINSGTLSVGNNGTTGTNGTIIGNVTNNGTLAFAKSNAVTFSGNISGSGAVVQQGINNLVLQGNNSYAGGTIVNAGSVTATTDGNLGAPTGSITLNGGTFATNGPISSARNIAVNSAGGSVNLASANSFSTNGTATGPGLLTKLGAGALSVSSFNLSALNVSAGAVVLLANGSKSGVVSVLTIGDNTTATTAKLDLNDNDLLINYSGSSPVATIRNLLIAGYNGGAWNGNGLTSTFAQSHAGQGLGYGEASDVGLTALDGNTISAPAVVVKYTYYGDSSLDGKVDLGNDFNLFLQGFLKPNLPTDANRWVFGDYNYDGSTTTADFQLFVDGFKAQGGQLGALDDVIQSSALLTVAQKAQLLEVVPEPTSIGLLAFAACVVAARRRKIL